MKGRINTLFMRAAGKTAGVFIGGCLVETLNRTLSML
jgi:hypothetical protein